MQLLPAAPDDCYQNHEGDTDGDHDGHQDDDTDDDFGMVFFFSGRAELIRTSHCTDRHLPDDYLQDDDRIQDDDGLGDKDTVHDFDGACPHNTRLGLYRSHRSYISSRAHPHGYRDSDQIQYLHPDEYEDGDRYRDQNVSIDRDGLRDQDVPVHCRPAHNLFQHHCQHSSLRQRMYLLRSYCEGLAYLVPPVIDEDR